MSSSSDIAQGKRIKKEAHIVDIVKAAEKIKVTKLYGAYSAKYRGTAIRTFLSEYLPALEYQGEIRLVVDGDGFWAYSRAAYEKEFGAS